MNSRKEDQVEKQLAEGQDQYLPLKIDNIKTAASFITLGKSNICTSKNSISLFLVNDVSIKTQLSYSDTGISLSKVRFNLQSRMPSPIFPK